MAVVFRDGSPKISGHRPHRPPLCGRVDFGSYADMGPYHGWIFAYQQLTLSLTSVFCVTPNGKVRGKDSSSSPVTAGVVTWRGCNAPFNSPALQLKLLSAFVISRAERMYGSTRTAGGCQLLPCSGIRGPLPDVIYDAVARLRHALCMRKCSSYRLCFLCR